MHSSVFKHSPTGGLNVCPRRYSHHLDCCLYLYLNSPAHFAPYTVFTHISLFFPFCHYSFWRLSIEMAGSLLCCTRCRPCASIPVIRIFEVLCFSLSATLALFVFVLSVQPPPLRMPSERIVCASRSRQTRLLFLCHLRHTLRPITTSSWPVVSARAIATTTL